MVFFNYATMQMAAKIVYYGPGLCGKTTNLRFIYEKTSPQSRGEMVSLETETDRTLFFDLLPLDVGVIGGFKTRLQLYTVPGQVFYNTTRKLVLKGVDGIVFVADSQRAMVDANRESFRNLRENLGEIGLNLDDLPLILQLNKRDLPNIAEAETILAAIDADGKYEAIESSAMTGEGVFETLKLISKLTLRTLRKRMMGEEQARQPPEPKSVFHVKGGRKAAGPGADSERRAAAPSHPAAHAEIGVVEPLEHPEIASSEARDEAFPMPDVDADIISSAPVEPGGGAAAEHRENPSSSAPEMKRLKVRSSIDIMAELEQLRKRATQTAASRRPERPKQARLAVPLPPEAASRSRRVRVSFAFEDEDGNVIAEESRTVDLDEADGVDSLVVDVKRKPGASGPS